MAEKETVSNSNGPQLLGCDGEHIQDFEDVLNEMGRGLPLLRELRDRLLGGHDGDVPLTTEQLTNDGLMLAYMIRYMEQVLDRGYELYFAQRKTAATSRS